MAEYRFTKILHDGDSIKFQGGNDGFGSSTMGFLKELKNNCTGPHSFNVNLSGNNSCVWVAPGPGILECAYIGGTRGCGGSVTLCGTGLSKTEWHQGSSGWTTCFWQGMTFDKGQEISVYSDMGGYGYSVGITGYYYC